jgi:signal transduction histidine kinase
MPIHKTLPAGKPWETNLFWGFVSCFWFAAGIYMSVADNLQRLDPEMELAIFRLVQECLTNIHRHSGSKTAHIPLAREADRIYVEVQDQGQGMSQERIAEVRSRGAGVGIRGMRERVRQLHGELVIESDAGGTKISASFPTAQHAMSV